MNPVPKRSSTSSWSARTRGWERKKPRQKAPGAESGLDSSAIVWRIDGAIHTHAFLSAGCDVDTDQMWALRRERLFQRGFEIFGPVHFLRGYPIALSYFNHVDAGQVHPRNVTPHLIKIAKGLQRRVVRISQHDDHNGEVVLSGTPESLDRILNRAISNRTHDSPVGMCHLEPNGRG